MDECGEDPKLLHTSPTASVWMASNLIPHTYFLNEQHINKQMRSSKRSENDTRHYGQECRPTYCPDNDLKASLREISQVKLDYCQRRAEICFSIRRW